MTDLTDWGALNDRIAGFEAGCDLNMPGGSLFMERAAREAVKNGTLDEKRIDRSVERILHLVEKGIASGQKRTRVDLDKHHELALAIAQQGAVLLKNEDHLLPLTSENCVLIGYMAQHMRYQGTGSSHINPARQVNPTDVLPQVPFVPCCDADGNVTEKALKEAVAAAAQYKVAIVVAGLPDIFESEGFDREHMRLPKGHCIQRYENCSPFYQRCWTQ